MEAVPKLPLIHFQLKTSPASTEFSHNLKQYIRKFYNEDPEAYNKEIKDLETLRQQAACNVQRDYTGCSILKKYYAQLQLLQSRFPMSEDGLASVTFMWQDTYSGNSSVVTDVKVEQACILHNIGALHSELGAIDSRQTSEGMKISCTHFQCAAWAFQHLRDNYPQPRDTDMSHDLLTFYINVMLGQAQECILEKSMLDNRKCTIVAKIAAQIVDYYKCAMKTLDKSSDGYQILSTVGPKTEKYWRKYLEFKIDYHGCVMYLYLGSQAEELQKMGERLAYYQCANAKLLAACKLAKGLEEDLNDSLAFTMDIVVGKLNAAAKENAFVYHEKTPSVESLPEVKGASLVKGIPFDPADPEISGRDIFARLVPMEAHEASSLYSEEKAKILREVNAKIEEKDHELMSYLSSLQLDQLKLTPEPDRLPQELVDCCAAISVKPNTIKELVTAMQNLSGMFHDVESIIQEIQALLDEEDGREKECLDMIGKRPPSMILLEMKEELKKYREAHKKATDSNMTLHKAMAHHISNLNLLSAPLEELEKNIPSLTIMDAPNDEGMRKEMRRLLTKVDEMKSQREMVEAQLRDQILMDDITKHLVSREDQNLQEVFSEELKKHDRTLSLINQNLAAQDNILKALTDANARYADTRRATFEISQRRRATIAGLIASYEAYEDLISKSQKGLEFYRKLEASVTKLLKRVQSVCRVQEEERDKIIESQVKKVNIEPAHYKNTSPANTNTGPKLKDYLKYMAPGSAAMNLSNSLSSTASTDVHSSYAAPFSMVASNQILSNPQESVPSRHPVYPEIDPTYPSTVVSSAFRPAPVGSDSTDTFITNCSRGNTMVTQPTRPDSTNSISNYYNNKGYQGYGMDSAMNYEQPYSVPTVEKPPNFIQTIPATASAHGNYYESPLPHAYGTVPVTSGALSSNYVHSYCTTNGQPTSNYSDDTPVSTRYPNTGVTNPPLTSSYSQYQYECGYGTTVPQNPTYVPYNQPSTSVEVATSTIGYPYSQRNYQDYTGSISQSTISPQIIGQQPQPHSSSTYEYSESHNGAYAPSVAQSNYFQTPVLQQQTTYAPTPNEAYYQPQQQSHCVNNAPLAYQIQDDYSYSTSQSTSSVPSTSENSNMTVKPQIQNNNPPRPDSNLSLLQQLDFSTTPHSSLVQTSSDHCNDLKPNSVYESRYQDTTNKDLLSKASSETNSEVMVLKPKVLTVEDIVMQKEQREREARCRAASRDPFSDPTMLERFVAEVEHFQKVVEGLNKQSLNGPTPLDQKWKELTEAQDRHSRRISISVARCYSLKNRVPDIMPYDSSRVEIASLKDDYINASYIKNLSKNTANYIATQAPLTGTMRDFWTMIYEQQSEVVAALVNDAELKGDIYWPMEKGQEIEFGTGLIVKLQSYKSKQWGVERIISITHSETRISRVIVHLQLTSWPPGGMPTSPALFLQFLNEVQTFHRDQRNQSRPIVVHCSAGAGRTGVFCLVATAIHEILAGSGIVDLWDLALKLVQMRKYVLQDKEHMKFCLHAVLYFAEDVLLKRGILIKRASFDDKVPCAASRKSSHTRHPSQDFVLPASYDEKSSVEADTALTMSPTKQTKEEQPKVSSEPVLSRSNSTASVASVASVGSSASMPLVLAPGTSPQHLPLSSKSSSTSTSSLPPSLANLDAAHFTLEPMPRKSKKITKESFLNIGSGLKPENGDPNDPLSQLDPLWSLNK